MIDLDQLDAQLERALTDDVRILRNGPARPRFDHSRPPGPGAGAPAPRTLAEKLASIDDDPDPEVEAGPAPRRQPPPPPPPQARPAPALADPAPVRTEPPVGPGRRAQAPLTRLHDAPFFEKRPAERAAPASARERLRQAAVRQAQGYGDDGTPGIPGLAERIPVLVAQGLVDDLDRDLAAHAAMASSVGSSDDRLAAATWKVMRSALDGDRGEARSALQVVGALGHGDDRYWTQRLWLGLEWGDEAERFALLEHCRERAYRHDDLAWRGRLCLLLARMGRTDEASREVDAVLSALGGPASADVADIVTNVAETVFLLADRAPAAALQRPLAQLGGHLVVVGPALVCKGARSRFSAHGAWAAGNAAAADRAFAAAADTHRALGARPLLVRTLREWGATLAGRDEVGAQRCLDEAEALARDLGLAEPAPALAG